MVHKLDNVRQALIIVEQAVPSRTGSLFSIMHLADVEDRMPVGVSFRPLADPLPPQRVIGYSAGLVGPGSYVQADDFSAAWAYGQDWFRTSFRYRPERRPGYELRRAPGELEGGG